MELERTGIEDLSSLSLKERKLIAHRRPSISYDLLPLGFRSRTFYIQFDMDAAKPRFIVLHKSATCSYEKLETEDKLQLLQTASNFLRKFRLQEAILSIPMGRENQLGIVYENFYAYIVLRDNNQYNSIFKTATEQMDAFKWPKITEWKTPLWISDLQSYRSVKLYTESVCSNACLDEFGIMSTSKETNNNYKVSKEPLQNFSFHFYEEKDVIGVTCSSATSVLDRWQYLDYIATLITEWNRVSKNLSCWMSVTLTSPFYLKDGKKAEALIKFPNGVPGFISTNLPMRKRRDKIVDEPIT